MLYFYQYLKKSLQQRPLLWLSLFLLIELGLFSFIHKGLGDYLSPIVVLIIPFIWCKVFLDFQPKSNISFNATISHKWFFSLLGFLSIVILYEEFRKVFAATNYMDIKSSDVIPQIYYMVKHFLANESPYQMLQEIPWKVESPYMPMHWLPFIIPVKLNSDLRWLPFIVFSIVTAFFGYYIGTKTQTTLIRKRWMMVIPVFCTLIILKYQNIYAYTVELLIMSYYFLLAIGVARNHFILQLVGICLTLLSRYMLVFWIPVYLFILFFYQSKKQALISLITMVMAVVGIYLLPFYAKDPTILSRGLNYHQKVIHAEWSNAVSTTTFSQVKHSGSGISSIFFALSGKDDKSLDTSISLLTSIQFISLTLVMLLSIVWFKKNPNKIKPSHFLLLVLKIVTTLFVVFNPLPFTYYLMSSFAISWVLYTEIATQIPPQTAEF